jgi:hypothetical protein
MYENGKGSEYYPNALLVRGVHSANRDRLFGGKQAEDNLKKKNVFYVKDRIYVTAYV